MYVDVIEALTIFNKYDHVRSIAAEHDILYAGPESEIVSPEDVARLEELGWYASDDGGFQKFV